MTTSTVDMFSLPCVVLSESLIKKGMTKESLPRISGMNELVMSLTTIRPTWIFSIHPDGYNSHWRLHVMDKGEQLGTVRWAWFRNQYGFSIHNRRIEQNKRRSSVYQTHDIKKAFLTIKKLFAADSVAERITQAVEKASNVIGTAAREKWHKVSMAERKLNAEAVEFALSVTDSFRVYLDTKSKRSVLESYEVARAEMLTIEAAKSAFDGNATALVIRVDGQYIVKLRDKIEIMDDTLLPSWLRAKVGMLKLVEDEHIISDVGVRVNAECFVVIVDQEGETK